MSDRLTYEQAAAILRCHFSNVAKLTRKGDLTSTGQRGASLNREQVEALAERRAEEREARADPTVLNVTSGRLVEVEPEHAA